MLQKRCKSLPSQCNDRKYYQFNQVKNWICQKYKKSGNCNKNIKYEICHGFYS